MKQRIIVILLLTMLVLSCNLLNQPGSERRDNVGLLPNGEQATDGEIQLIQELEPQAKDIYNSFIKSKSLADMTKEDFDSLIEKYVALLKEAFGENYRKFYITREQEKLVNLTTNEVVSNANSKAVGEYIVPVGNGYYLRCVGGQGWLPWCAWNYGQSYFRVYLGNGNYTDVAANFIWTQVSDKNGTVSRGLYNINFVDAGGNGDYYFWPSNFSFDTTHSVTYPYITGGSASYSYHWF